MPLFIEKIHFESNRWYDDLLPKIDYFVSIVGLFSLRCLPNEFSEERYSIFMVVGYHMDNIHVQEMV